MTITNLMNTSFSAQAGSEQARKHADNRLLGSSLTQGYFNQ